MDKKSWTPTEYHFNTRAIHAGQEPDPTTGAIMTPLYLTSTYVQPSPGVHKGYEYSRTSNPTRKAYEDCIANLESGHHGFAYASGCAASTTVIHLLKAGSKVVTCDDMYGGTFRLFDKVLKKFDIEFIYLDLTKKENIEKIAEIKPDLVWVESPTNPTLKIIDIAHVSKACKTAKALLTVDNTFMSPYLQNPLTLGADIVVHSATKFINGHSDVVGGVIVVKDQELADQVHFVSNSMGPMASPFDSFLAMRSLKTLGIRMDAHQKNAMAIAKFLEDHSNVEKVLYPGLESHPQYAIGQKQMTGPGGMITMYLKGGLKESSDFLEKVSVFALAESLGGVESLIEHPGIMTHASVPADKRKELGIDDNLIRISVGIEGTDDLIKDLEQALNF